jgi:hypothetical protein
MERGGSVRGGSGDGWIGIAAGVKERVTGGGDDFGRGLVGKLGLGTWDVRKKDA